jgi:solute carrier family 25 phosphate transporter 23/24/25/41
MKGTDDDSLLSTRDLLRLSVGGIAGGISRTAVSPLERLKILYQVQYVTLQKNPGADSKYKGFGQSLRTIWREEGIRGMYRGNGANVIRVFPYVGTQFMCFSRFKRAVLARRPDGPQALAPLEKLGVGAAAGVLSVVATYPLDLVRGRLTAQGGAMKMVRPYTGMLDALVRIGREGGVRALYKGMAPNVIGIGPYVGVNYAVFETLKERCPVERGASGPSPLWLMACGAVAGTSGQTVAYPMDLLRRRFQMPGADYGSVGNALRRIVAEEGVLGLYKGYLPNFVKVVPTIAVMFWSNDMLKRAAKTAYGVDL